MIKKVLILLVLTLSVASYGSSKWRKVSEATYSSLSDVFFLDESHGWIAGSTGTLLRTTDGGYTWEEPTETLPVIQSMYSVYFINENVGYAGGAHDLLLKTIDGGATWIEINLDADDGTIYSLYFVDENRGWVLNGKKIIYTNDGGASWAVQVTESSVTLKAMSFNSPGHGVCVGGKSGVFAFYYTSDGLNWTKAPNPTGIPGIYSRNDIYTVAMASDDVACVTGWGSSAAGLQPSFTMRTSDGGANWAYETQAEEDRLYVSMYGMYFLDELTGFAVGGSSYKGGVTYKTTDGGLTWKEIYLPMGFQGKAISMINDKICVVGGGGGIAISDDAGTTWNLVTNIINSTLYDIDQLPNGNIVAAGFYGGILISTDKGETWKSSFVSGNNVCPTVESLYFLDDNIGYAAQRNRTVSKTTDGGLSWTQIMKDTMATSINNYDVQFLNEDVGFVVGKGESDVSAFYKTFDGGDSWSSLIAAPGLTNELNALHFFDANNGVVVGDESVIAFTIDGGNFWNTVKANNTPGGNFDYDKMEFLNDSFGLACGDILIKSTDAGKTWDYVAVDGLTKDIEGCAIVDELTWYITGSKFLLKTTDGGITWTELFDEEIITANTCYDILIDTEGYPWLACGSSEIYTSSPVVGVEKTRDNLVNSFSLEANYPNPFNPSTKIKYSLQSSSLQNVTLKVFDMLGQEVATIVNETQKSGTYEVDFNASKLTSGIYIYTLQSAGLLQSRKMLLIK